MAEIWRVIGQIRTSGIATLIVDRDYRKVLAQADRALVLQKGRVVLQCAADDLQGDPRLAAFLGVQGPGAARPSAAVQRSSEPMVIDPPGHCGE